MPTSGATKLLAKGAAEVSKGTPIESFVKTTESFVKKLFKNEDELKPVSNTKNLNSTPSPVRTVDELAPVPNSRTNGLEYQSATKRNLTSEELMQKYNVQPSAQMKAYQDELADIRAGRTSKPAQTQKKGNGTENTVNQNEGGANSGNKKPLTEESNQPNTQGIKPQTKTTGIGSSLVKKAAITTGVIGLTTAGLVGIPQLLSNIPGADGNNDEGGSQGGNDQGGLWEIIRSLFGGSQTPGGTYYLGGGNDPGEPDRSETSIVNEAAEAVSQSLPYILIGVGILVIILAITKNGKKSGKPSAAKKTAKKGGSHA